MSFSDVVSLIVIGACAVMLAESIADRYRNRRQR